MSNQKELFKKISNIKLFYEGYHNKTYKGFFCGELVQIRIVKNNIVNHVNEIKLLTNQSDIIYIDNSIMIKKWVPGHHLNTNDINTLKNIKLSLNQHWNTKIDGITFFDNATNVKDIVLSHGDLRPQNIIVNDYQDIVLIDFEWTNYNSKYFDLSHLYLYCSFAIDDIVSVFNVDKEKLLKAVINVRKFNTNWEKKEYKKNLD